MAQQEVGDAVKHFPHPHPQGPNILGQVLPAVPLAQKSVLLRATSGAAVAQVVVSAHGEAVAGEEAGEVVIAPHVLRDAVDQLHHPPGGALREPSGDLDGVVAGGEGEGRKVCHSQITSSVVQYPKGRAQTAPSDSSLSRYRPPVKWGGP